MRPNTNWYTTISKIPSLLPDTVNTVRDVGNCESPFDYADYEEASVFFTQTLRQLVINAKLDRPPDSHAPQSEDTYYYSDDVWGDIPEQESEEQWEYHEEYDPEEQRTYEAYPAEEE